MKSLSMLFIAGFLAILLTGCVDTAGDGVPGTGASTTTGGTTSGPSTGTGSGTAP